MCYLKTNSNTQNPTYPIGMMIGSSCICGQSYATKRQVRQKGIRRQPSHRQSVHRQPDHHQPVYQQPAYQQPAYQQPAYQQPAYQQPAYHQPFYHQPVYHQPAYQQPVYYQPAYYQSAQYQPAYYQPNYQQSVHQRPIYNQTVPSETFFIKKTYPIVSTSKTSQYSNVKTESTKSPLESEKKTSTNRETVKGQQHLLNSTPQSGRLHHEVAQPITDTLRERVSETTVHQRSLSPSPLLSPEIEWICVEEEQDEKSRRNKSRKTTHQHDSYHKRAEEKKSHERTQSKIEPRYYTYRYVKGISTRNSPPREILHEKR